MSQPHFFDFECREQPIEKVIVFNDRAEVSRRVSAEIKPGLNEIILRNVSQQTIEDSLRVDGRGEAVIHEVLIQKRAALVEEIDSPEVAELRSNLKEKQPEVNGLKDRHSILKKRVEALDKVVMALGNPTGEKGTSPEIDDAYLSKMEKFYTFYDNQSTTVRAELRLVEEALEKSEAELGKIGVQLVQKSTNERQNKVSKCFVIVLESKEGVEIELQVTYQVRGASWVPSYDLRVDTTDRASMKISYYGKITQQSGEDWAEAPIVLSTAQPSLGGNMPRLGTLEVSFHPRILLAEDLRELNGCERRSAPMNRPRDFVTRSSSNVAIPIEQAQASKVEELALSTEFTISRPANIPSNSDGHKVTIGILETQPSLHHECVPSKNPSVFLTATATNNSSMPFISGQASVFVNNAFVSKIQLKNIAPEERFLCSLGVDASVKVKYHPLKKYNEKLGLINKSSFETKEQVISVKNTKHQPILLTIHEHIPRPTEEKIKVRVLNPPLLKEDQAGSHLAIEGARINSRHNLVWTLKLAERESQNLVFKYTLEHPKENAVYFSESH